MRCALRTPTIVIALIAVASMAGAGCQRESRPASDARAAPEGFPPPPLAPYEVAGLTNGGMISGSVHLDGPASGDTTIQPMSDLAVCGDGHVERRLLVSDGRVAGAVVWLGNIRAGKRLPPERLFEVQHDDCRLLPRVQAALAGGTLNVRSADPVSHHTRFTHLHTRETLGIIRQSDAGSVVPHEGLLARPGLVRVRCDVHPWTTAWIAVFDHPYFAVTDAEGRFALTEVPPGRYTLVVWHERLGATEQEVVVEQGREAVVEVRAGS